ncbi:hypothetical protein CO115_03530 [Candidatus Falkowbacteria bacterium CG_4_9_14_3_um_filter_36_9]|uniref:Uncharacterized protein n=2 Tax=Candidatus Falkowiibacteriota TaxID=1752728 RepID=A0A1J4T4G6_9BACT|nr:MAG: hypothetical protein AUJ27_03210 [Candidatus Falkowbacteria bacterium CG1_02_37_44]PIV50499.1 MAG: hypothetical protein COS18_04930 [Candidatus Falkowbacteria bacterium CG02_land_8_20_14_3_00_36_14]PIX10863.1 MAG: hypothetical protein COZ73_04375 [Candidatus Falkowbacteria bacterium CG_4_8_14_3_um_filter_36_11]PJA10132.1 MAG: hypothetical protein COX67_05370 [Candidatus Falkowbacteria bacterium CG_4_10_14_0_2_um_filter_36_22]PJB18906.1 MAG: hypothetical protein CO115_03530 [Candidatus F
MPKSAADWQDVIKIANGRWTSERSQAAEDRAKVSFKKVYGREPVIKSPTDANAVMIMAYGLRPVKRNINSEKNSIISFIYYYKKIPASAGDWDIVRAIAYGGAKR